MRFFVCVKDKLRHSKKCTLRHPPGDEIYREGDISFFEVNPSYSLTTKTYCENLAYISKMFLNVKNLYITMERFIFYVLCEVKKDGFHFMGYFSKDKKRYVNKEKLIYAYNLSCFMVMPFCQKGGYGTLMIKMSYALSKIEDKPGGPEQPFSVSGELTYLKYWSRVLIECLLELEEKQEEITLKEIREKTGITEDDIMFTFKKRNLINDQSELLCDKEHLLSILNDTKLTARKGREILPELIRWLPLVSKDLDEMDETDDYIPTRYF